MPDNLDISRQQVVKFSQLFLDMFKFMCFCLGLLSPETVKVAYEKQISVIQNIFFNSQPKHLLWVLKRSDSDIETVLLYSKTCVKRLLSKRSQIGFQDQLSLNAGKMYCRMLQAEHSAILLTFIKLSIVIKTFVLSIFEWPFYTGFTVIKINFLIS